MFDSILTKVLSYFTLGAKRKRILGTIYFAIEELNNLVDDSYVIESKLDRAREDLEERIQTLEEEANTTQNERIKAQATIDKLSALVGE